MFFDYTVEIPKVPGKITRQKQAKSTYILFEKERIYLPEKQYTRVKRVLIGKEVPNSSTMYPNENYLEFFSPSIEESQVPEVNRSCCLKVGPYLVIRKVIEHYDLQKILSKQFGKDTGFLLDLASYFIVTEDNVGQYYPDYAFCHPLFTEKMRIFSDSKVSRFLNSVTQEQIIGFLNSWNKVQDHRQRIYISYDGSNKNSQAGDIDIVEFGKAKDDKGLPIFNIALAFDKTNRVPLFYEQYPGSINDISQFPYFVDKVTDYGYRSIGFILDRGYFSRDNIKYMDEKKYQFLMMVKGCKPLVSSLIQEVKGSFEQKWDNFIDMYDVYGITISKKLFSDDQNKRYFHLFFSANKMAAERTKIQNDIKQCKKFLEKSIGKKIIVSAPYINFFDCFFDEEGILKNFVAKNEAIENLLNLCGYFCLISSEQMDAKEALTLYKGRDISEKLFRADKTFLGCESMRVQSNSAVATKIFVEFIALIIRNRMYNLLKDEMLRLPVKKNFLTVPAAIRELGKIEMIRRSSNIYKLDHAVTKTQKQILASFGISTEEVKEGAKRIAQILKAQRADLIEDDKKETGVYETNLDY